MHDVALHGAGGHAAAAWDLLVRASGVCLALLLAAAYATGEEFQHTHMLIAYGFAALAVANLYWELVRTHPPALRGAEGLHIVGVLLRAAQTGRAAIAPALTAMAVALLLGVLAAATLLTMALTHTLWPAAAVDEMHEAVAYFALGLVVAHIATVLIASSEALERRLARLFPLR